MRRGEYQNFTSKIFCLTLPKNFVGEPFSVSLVSGIEKFLCFGGLCHDFSSKIFCLTVPEHFVEEPFCAVFQKISVSEKVMDKREGKYQDFLRKVFVSRCRKMP